jgi:hypothetical protein
MAKFECFHVLPQICKAKIMKLLYRPKNLSNKTGKSQSRGKGTVLHVQLSTNCGLGCFRNMKIFELSEEKI